MQFPTVTQICCTAFVLYILHLIWSLSKVFSTLKCTETQCYSSFLTTEPKLELLMFTSPTRTPTQSQFIGIDVLDNFNISVEQKK